MFNRNIGCIETWLQRLHPQALTRSTETLDVLKQLLRSAKAVLTSGSTETLDVLKHATPCLKLFQSVCSTETLDVLKLFDARSCERALESVQPKHWMY